VPASRRDFLQTASALAAAGFLPRSLPALPSISSVVSPEFRARPCVVASANGLRGVKVAYDRITAGEDPLDAIIAGVNIQELDPEDQSVGLGGLPNAEGVVTLDASCMHGPTRRAGAVACIEDIATPSLVAKAVLDYTDHVLLVGPQARRFAIEMGFTPQNLLTEKSRQDWLRWRARLNPNDAWLDYDGNVNIRFHTGTINMNAVTVQRRYGVRDHHQRHVLEGARSGGRFADHRRRTVLRQHGGRGRLHGAWRGQHQGLRSLSGRGVHAAGLSPKRNRCCGSCSA
jgi:N4-(beta-N-acetylglucosaminyl)-L-asparaginase